jgi:hypothetical protein
VSKFLLNLLVQISKALVNSKIQFLFWKDFFQLPVQSTQLPVGPPGPANLPLPPSPAPTECCFLLARHLTKAAMPASSRAMEWTRPVKLLITPLYSAAFPPPPPLHSGNSSIEDTIYHRRPAYPAHLHLPPNPIKGEEHPRPLAPLFPSLLSSLAPSVALVPSSSPRHSLPPSRRLSTTAQALVRPESGSPCFPLSVVPPPMSSCAPEWP